MSQKSNDMLPEKKTKFIALLEELDGSFNKLIKQHEQAKQLADSLENLLGNYRKTFRLQLEGVDTESIIDTVNNLIENVPEAWEPKDAEWQSAKLRKMMSSQFDQAVSMMLNNDVPGPRENKRAYSFKLAEYWGLEQDLDSIIFNARFIYAEGTENPVLVPTQEIAQGFVIGHCADGIYIQETLPINMRFLKTQYIFSNTCAYDIIRKWLVSEQREDLIINH